MEKKMKIKNEAMGEIKGTKVDKPKITKAVVEKGGDLRANSTGGPKADGAI